MNNREIITKMFKFKVKNYILWGIYFFHLFLSNK